MAKRQVQSPVWFRVARAILALIGCLYISRDALSLFKSPALVQDKQQIFHSSLQNVSDKYTVVMATYKRLDNLEQITKAYASGKYASVDRVIIIWQDNTTSPSDWLLPLEKQPIPVHVRRSKINSMNERFRLDHRIRTEAVFMVDDDINIQSSDLELAFQTWKALGKDQRIVGFTARDYKVSGDRMTYMPFVAKSYSMILSNAAFLHRSFFEYYWSDAIRPYREYVDEVFNCDDLLINFLVSNLTAQPPLLFQPARHVLSYPDKTGLWQRPDHFETRTQCLNQFAQMMGRNPLVQTKWSVGADIKDRQREMTDLSETVESQEWIRVD